MDDSHHTTGYQLRKVLRYVRLYGPRRTIVKIQGRWSRNRRYDPLPATSPPRPGQTVGLIGCGNYAFTNIAYYLVRRHGHVIGSCMDIDVHRAVSLSRRFRVPRYTTDAGEVIDDDAIRMIYIASNHASHADYAVRALDRGKDVYIEKPHVVSEEQLARLVRAMRDSQGRVYLGFNRTQSRLAQTVRQYINQQRGPGMYNWFVAGHRLPADHWYHSDGEGGRVLGNLCHWTDFLYWLHAPHGFPIRIRPARSQSGRDMIVTLLLGDDSMGVITFSEKGSPFEGVHEKLCGHRGDLLFQLDGFQKLTVHTGPKKRTVWKLFRDHGHCASICRAFENAAQRLPYDRAERQSSVAQTAWLFLNVKRAIDEDREVVVNAYEPCASTSPAAGQAA